MFCSNCISETLFNFTKSLISYNQHDKSMYSFKEESIIWLIKGCGTWVGRGISFYCLWSKIANLTFPLFLLLIAWCDFTLQPHHWRSWLFFIKKINYVSRIFSKCCGFSYLIIFGIFCSKLMIYRYFISWRLEPPCKVTVNNIIFSIPSIVKLKFVS